MMNLFLEKKEKKNKNENRKERVRYKTKKVSSRNRLTVFRSNNHIYAQLIDDKKGITIS